MNTSTEHFTYKEFAFDMHNDDHEHAIWVITPLTKNSNIIDFIGSLSDDPIFAFIYAHKFHRTIVSMDQYCVSTINSTENSISCGIGSTIIIYTSNNALGTFNYEPGGGKIYKQRVHVRSDPIEGVSALDISDADVVYAKGYNIPNSMVSVSFSTNKFKVIEKYEYAYDEYASELIYIIHLILADVFKDIPNIDIKFKFFIEEFEESGRYQYSINCKLYGFEKYFIYAATPNTFISYITDECDIKDYNTKEFKAKLAAYLSTSNSIILPVGSICKLRSINMNNVPAEYFNEYLFSSLIILENDCEIPVPLVPVMENVQNIYHAKKYKKFKSRKENREVLFISRIIPKYIGMDTGHPLYLIKYKQNDSENEDMLRHLHRFFTIISGGKEPFGEEFDEKFVTCPINFLSYRLLLVFKK